jgi:YVTN family beta-propeller protein
VVGYATGSFGGNLLSVAVTADDKTAYVGSTNDFVYAVDLETRSVIASINVGGWANDIAMHPSLARAYASLYNAGRIAEINTSTNQLVRTFDVGGNPQGLAVSPGGGELYIANEKGELDIWDLAANALKQIVPLPGGPFGLALTPDGAQIYLAFTFGGSGFVQILDRSSRSLLRTLRTGGYPRRIAFDLAGTTAVITDDGSRVFFVR